jgi:hypothetical protein
MSPYCAVFRDWHLALMLVWAVIGGFTLSSCSTPPSASRTGSPMISDSSSSPATVQLQSTTKMPNSSNPTATNISAPIRCYVNAVNAKNLNALVACFASDAVVIDVNRKITGVDAIRTWANNEVIGGSLRVIESTPTPNGVRLLVHWAPGGSNGWRAYYTFDYQNGQITQADLQYAN